MAKRKGLSAQVGGAAAPRSTVTEKEIRAVQEADAWKWKRLNIQVGAHLHRAAMQKAQEEEVYLSEQVAIMLARWVGMPKTQALPPPEKRKER